MISACLIATSMNLNQNECMSGIEPDSIVEDYDAVDGPSEEEAHLQGLLSIKADPPCELTSSLGEYKTILQLVGVLSHGKTAKRLADDAVDLMQDVQNLRKAIYECVIYPLKRRASLTSPPLMADSRCYPGDLAINSRLKLARKEARSTPNCSSSLSVTCSWSTFFFPRGQH